MLKKISARKLLTYHPQQLSQMLTGEFILVFDDGEVQTNAKEALYSRYAWRFHLEYPETPMLMKHHVGKTLGDKKLGSKTHLSLLGDVMWSTHEVYSGRTDSVALRDVLSRMVYEITNEMYCELSYEAEADVVSIDITDFMEIIDHPIYQPVKAAMTPDQGGIDRSYSALLGILNSPTIIPLNPVVAAIQAQLVDKNQVLQSVGPRGFLTDIDSVQFPHPIERGYVEGFRSLHDSMIESRSSAKSLYFSKSPLEDAEYFSRKLQLLCQIVQNLHPGDCGSKHYLTWHVRGPEYEDGVQTFKGDLPFLEGKYYLGDDGKTLQIFNKGDKHLIGKTIQVRSVVAGCEHPDPHGLCSVCFGSLAQSVPERTNIGHMCATSMTEKSSQSVLSVKHSDGNAVIDGVVVSDEFKPWVAVNPSDTASYLLNRDLQGRSPKLVVQQAEAAGLTDVDIVEDINDLNITRVSAITFIGVKTEYLIRDTGEIVIEAVAIPVSMSKRLASFTYPLLQHIKDVGWEVDEKGNLVIDMGGWDFSKPILTLPMKHFNMGDHSEDIAKIIESRVDMLSDRDTAESPAATLHELYELVNSKLNVNVAVLEIIIYAAEVVSARENNFNLPKPWTTKGLGVSGPTLAGRSLAPAMAYERHRDTIVNPASFLNEQRPSHPMDVFVAPQEAVMDAMMNHS